MNIEEVEFRVGRGGKGRMLSWKRLSEWGRRVCLTYMSHSLFPFVLFVLFSFICISIPSVRSICPYCHEVGEINGRRLTSEGVAAAFLRCFDFLSSSTRDIQTLVSHAARWGSHFFFFVESEPIDQLIVDSLIGGQSIDTRLIPSIVSVDQLVFCDQNLFREIKSRLDFIGNVCLCFFFLHLFFLEAKRLFIDMLKYCINTLFKQRTLISFDDVIPFREPSLSPSHRILVCLLFFHIHKLLHAFSRFHIFAFSGSRFTHSILSRMLFFLCLPNSRKSREKETVAHKHNIWVTFLSVCYWTSFAHSILV